MAASIPGRFPSDTSALLTFAEQNRLGAAIRSFTGFNSISDIKSDADYERYVDVLCLLDPTKSKAQLMANKDAILKAGRQREASFYEIFGQEMQNAQDDNTVKKLASSNFFAAASKARELAVLNLGKKLEASKKPENHCWTCDQESLELLPCPTCNIAVYCSKDCLRADSLKHREISPICCKKEDEKGERAAATSSQHPSPGLLAIAGLRANPALVPKVDPDAIDEYQRRTALSDKLKQRSGLSSLEELDTDEGYRKYVDAQIQTMAEVYPHLSEDELKANREYFMTHKNDTVASVRKREADQIELLEKGRKEAETIALVQQLQQKGCGDTANLVSQMMAQTRLGKAFQQESSRQQSVSNSFKRCGNSACKIIPDINLVYLRCTGCRSVEYCSKKCQKAHWTVHKVDSPGCKKKK